MSTARRKRTRRHRRVYRKATKLQRLKAVVPAMRKIADAAAELQDSNPNDVVVVTIRRNGPITLHVEPPETPESPRFKVVRP